LLFAACIFRELRHCDIYVGSTGGKDIVDTLQLPDYR